MTLPHLTFVLLGSVASAALIGINPQAGSKPPAAYHAIQTADNAQTAAPVRAERSADGLFYVTAQAGPRQMRFLIDTGASMTVVSRTEAEALHLTVRRQAGPALRTVGGTISGGWAKLPSLRIGGREITDVDVIVVDHGAPAPLLGQNALSRLGPVVLDANQVVIN